MLLPHLCDAAALLKASFLDGQPVKYFNQDCAAFATSMFMFCLPESLSTDLAGLASRSHVGFGSQSDRLSSRWSSDLVYESAAFSQMPERRSAA
jgi:hypothetical protein